MGGGSWILTLLTQRRLYFRPRLALHVAVHVKHAVFLLVPRQIKLFMQGDDLGWIGEPSQLFAGARSGVSWAWARGVRQKENNSAAKMTTFRRMADS